VTPAEDRLEVVVGRLVDAEGGGEAGDPLAIGHGR
jgi:hypothetical protein